MAGCLRLISGGAAGARTISAGKSDVRFYLLLLTLLLNAGGAVRAQDSLYVYGGPGTLEGKFETAGGLPDRQGWIGVDLSNQNPNHWHIDTFNCANLDPGQPNNHAWWCGEVLEACDPEDPPEGYRNMLRDWLDWYGEVADTSLATTVTIDAILNFDTEPGYDYLRLQCWDESGMQDLESYFGQAGSVIVDASATISPAGYVPHPDTGLPAIHLRWEVTSDGAWSDEDCEWPTAGAAQIDLISVFFDQGGGPVQIGTNETCEPGNPTQWSQGEWPQVGDFSKVWPLLDDADPNVQNNTPQFAFIDDGEVVPGTGGTPCCQPMHCYGPDEWCINIWGGLAGPDFDLLSEIWSPVITVPEDEFDKAVFAYTEYLDNGTCWPDNLVFTVWRVRSTTDPAGEVGWTEWRNHGELGGGRQQYRRVHKRVDDLLVPGARSIQLALGIDENGHCPYESFPTPAPYFDDAAFYLVSGLSGLPELDPVLHLGKPVPNPFNPGTSITFTLPVAGPVWLAVYDLRGQLVNVLVNEQRPAGAQTVSWDGRDDQGAATAAGTYLFRLDADGKQLIRKGSLLK